MLVGIHMGKFSRQFYINLKFRRESELVTEIQELSVSKLPGKLERKKEVKAESWG